MTKPSGKGTPLSRQKRRPEKAQKERARQRLEVIFKVRSGQMTAVQAAESLGVSRKTYYEWENRALNSMLHSLEDGKPGRPPSPVDPEKESLQKKVNELEKELILANLKLDVQELLRDLPEARATKETTRETSRTRSKKNNRTKKK